MKENNAEFNHKTQNQECAIFKKTLGDTTYTVSVHFSQKSKETFEDEIHRLIKSEVMNIA